MKSDGKDPKAGQAALRGGHTRHWLDYGDQWGIRYEKGVHHALEDWLDAYTAARPYTDLEVELLWSDRFEKPGHTRWRAFRNELGIPAVRAIWNCDFIIRTTWTQADGPPLELLIIGDVYPHMEAIGRSQLRDACAHLAQATQRYRVLPAYFGVRGSRQRPPSDMPDLVHVQVLDDDLTDRWTLHETLEPVPPGLFAILDRLLDAAAQQ